MTRDRRMFSRNAVFQKLIAKQSGVQNDGPEALSQCATCCNQGMQQFCTVVNKANGGSHLFGGGDSDADDGDMLGDNDWDVDDLQSPEAVPPASAFDPFKSNISGWGRGDSGPRRVVHFATASSKHATSNSDASSDNSSSPSRGSSSSEDSDDSDSDFDEAPPRASSDQENDFVNQQWAKTTQLAESKNVSLSRSMPNKSDVAAWENEDDDSSVDGGDDDDIPVVAPEKYPITAVGGRKVYGELDHMIKTRTATIARDTGAPCTAVQLCRDNNLLNFMLNSLHCQCELYSPNGCFHCLETSEILGNLKQWRQRRCFQSDGTTPKTQSEHKNDMILEYKNMLIRKVVGNNESRGGVTHEMQYTVGNGTRVCGRTYRALTGISTTTGQRYLRQAIKSLAGQSKPTLVLSKHESGLQHVFTSSRKKELAYSWLCHYFLETGQEQPGRAPRLDGKPLRHVDPFTATCKLCRGRAATLCTTSTDDEVPWCLYGRFASDMLADKSLAIDDIAKASCFQEAILPALFETNTRQRKNKGAASDCMECNTRTKEVAKARGDPAKLKQINAAHRKHTQCWMRLRQEDGHYGLLSLETVMRKDRDGWLSGMLDGAGSDWAWVPFIAGPKGKGSNARDHRLHFKPMVHFARGFGVGITLAPPWLASGVDLNLTCMLLVLDSIVKEHGFLPANLYESFDGGDKNVDSSSFVFYGLLVHWGKIKKARWRRHFKGHSHMPCDGENSRITGVLRGPAGSNSGGRHCRTVSELLGPIMDLAFNAHQRRLHHHAVLAGTLSLREVLHSMLPEHHTPISSNRHYLKQLDVNDKKIMVRNPQKKAEVHDVLIQKNSKGRVCWWFKTKYDLEHNLEWQPQGDSDAAMNGIELFKDGPVPTITKFAAMLKVGGFNSGSSETAPGRAELQKLLNFMGRDNEVEHQSDALIFRDNDRQEWTHMLETMMPSNDEEHQDMLQAVKSNPEKTPIKLVVPDFSVVASWPNIITTDDDMEVEDEDNERRVAQAARPPDIVTSQSFSADAREEQLKKQHQDLIIAAAMVPTCPLKKNVVVLIRFRAEGDPFEDKGTWAMARTFVLSCLSNGGLEHEKSNAPL